MYHFLQGKVSYIYMLNKLGFFLIIFIYVYLYVALTDLSRLKHPRT